MKILFDHGLPFQFAHGGFQVQIQKTMDALQEIGMEVEYLRWWDEDQRGDIIHHFGAAPLWYLHHARSKGIPVVMTTLFTETCNRSDLALAIQGLVTKGILKLPLFNGIKNQLSWKSFLECSMNVVGLNAESKVLTEVFGVSQDKVSIVPLGTGDCFLSGNNDQPRGNYLISAGTITQRKNTIPLAMLAKRAGVPILFVGDPYSKNDPYWCEFQAMIDDTVIMHRPHICDPGELAREYRSARGFVIMSKHENWCLTAHEAAACGLPLLLPDQPWSRERFGENAHYFQESKMSAKVSTLRYFYDQCEHAFAPHLRFYRWKEVASQMQMVYQKELVIRLSGNR